MKSIYLLLAFVASLFAVPYMPVDNNFDTDCCPKTEVSVSRFEQTVKDIQAERRVLTLEKREKERKLLKAINTLSQKSKTDTTVRPF